MFSFGSAPIASTPVLDRLRIELPIGAVSAPPLGRSPTRMLPSYVTYFQRRSLWCWAAVAMSIARFYRPNADDVTGRPEARRYEPDDVRVTRSQRAVVARGRSARL